LVEVEDALAGRGDPLFDGDGLVGAARRLVLGGQVAPGGDSAGLNGVVGVLGAEDALAGGGDPLFDGDCLASTARRLVPGDQVVLGDEGVGASFGGFAGPWPAGHNPYDPRRDREAWLPCPQEVDQRHFGQAERERARELNL
jgi:hypothetical protein